MAIFILSAFSASAQTQGTVAEEEVFDILQHEPILNAAEKGLLAEYIQNLDKRELTETQLDELGLAVRNKINRDVKNLSNLIFYLRLLVDNKLARHEGKVREKDIEKIEGMIAGLKEETKNFDERVILEAERPSTQELVGIIQQESRNLLGNGHVTTTGDVWEATRQVYEKPYARWSAWYEELKSQLFDENTEVYGPRKEGEDKFSQWLRTRNVANAALLSPDPVRAIEEINFLKNFGKARMIFRRLSEPNSTQFQ